MMIKKESFYFESRYSELQIHALKWLPAAEVKAVLIVAHGMAEHIERYDKFAVYMAERGILVAGCDYLGHGKTAGGQHSYGYFCPRDPATVVVRDVHRLKKLIQNEYPTVPFIIMGHSMGSFVARNYITRYGSGVKGAILMGTGMPPKLLVTVSRFLAGTQALFAGAKKPGKLLDRLAFGEYNKKIKEAGSKFAWLSINTENVVNYEADPLCGFMFSINGFQTLFELLRRLHDPKLLAAIPAALPLLIVSGANDPVGDYGRGPQKAKESLRKAGVKDIRLITYSWGRHEILHEAESEEVCRDIADWIEALWE
ncbi:MAG: lysophospholipase [Lachnospiraceae bacterium]|jgi:alpha-beta hydrolase superfamily lysophospholipase|nr:lysophospholipase [Lachnospiraceae bacterium]